jgi:hypothetical protein
MAAWLEIGVECGSSALIAGFAYGNRFGMRIAVFPVIPASDDSVAIDDHGSNHWIRGY